MPESLHEVRSGAYFDSVVLMHLQRELAALDGVIDAGVVMATEANKNLLEDRDMLPEDTGQAGADDLLIVVRGETARAAREALSQVDDLLKQRRQAQSQAFRPKSLESAVAKHPGAEWVLISVPGRYAARVARDALGHGKHVFLYSDNVSLEDELALKRRGVEQGLLVMGPDCGTAIINGVGLGFANIVRRGVIGIVAASGTGLQAVVTRIHALGSGVSQAIGTGGRDLSEEVGGLTAHQGLNLLARDEATEVIVLVSKPPAPSVATRLLDAAAAAAKPVVVLFLGYATPWVSSSNLHFARNIREAADLAIQLSGNGPPGFDGRPRGAVAEGRSYVRGLFSGGTLAAEALAALSTRLSPVYSNLGKGVQRLDDPTESRAHTIVDLGEDEFTVGRLHPMMDNDLRIQRLREEAEDSEVAIILLDVVLGEGAHPDPASELAPVIQDVVGSSAISVAAIVIGTEEDPQGLENQVETLKQAGAVVFSDTLEACDYVVAALTPGSRQPIEPVDLDRFRRPLAAINVGLESFSESLEAQGASVIQMDWRPPAGGDRDMMDLLARMK